MQLLMAISGFQPPWARGNPAPARVSQPAQAGGALGTAAWGCKDLVSRPKHLERAAGA